MLNNEDRVPHSARNKTTFLMWDTLEKLQLLVHFSKNKPETLSKDCSHLVESIGTAIWVLSICFSHRLSLKWPVTSKKEILGLPGVAVVKGAVLQRQLYHQRLWVRTQALS